MDQATRIEAIAFDFDMTLVDSRSVSQRALERLVCEYGAQLDIDTLMSTYGLPLPRWLPASIDGALFRTLESQDIALAVAMPGAAAALAAGRQAGARAVVVTSAPLRSPSECFGPLDCASTACGSRSPESRCA